MKRKSGPSHRTSEQGALEPEQGRCGRRTHELTQQPATRGPGKTLQSSGAPAVPTAHLLWPVRGNKPEGATAFRNKIYSNLKQNSFQEKDMKSQFPSALSGLRGQGPDARSGACCPAPAPTWQPWPREVGTELTGLSASAHNNTCISNDKRFKNSIFI